MNPTQRNFSLGCSFLVAPSLAWFYQTTAKIYGFTLLHHALKPLTCPNGELSIQQERLQAFEIQCLTATGAPHLETQYFVIFCLLFYALSLLFFLIVFLWNNASRKAQEKTGP
ncbi:MAG: hypothetical protein HUU38_25550 [Anaerolineales bacterium]|nr:hypothetical protein [Anaerolineales bacterium]